MFGPACSWAIAVHWAASLCKESMVMDVCDICSERSFKVLWYSNGYEIRQCPACDLIYTNVSESDILHAYEIDYYKSVYPDYENDRNIHELNNMKLLQKIERYFAPGTLIEIGSAFGFFLAAAGRRNWNAYGYETSEYASTVARTKYHQDVRTVDFLVDPLPAKVDLICMFDTIEHLLRPSLYVEKISSSLKPGGGLVITTGDISSWAARLSGKRWRMIVPPLHVYYYSRKTITRLLEKYGFKILSISNEWKYQNLNSIFTYQFGIDKKAIPQIPIRVNLGDIMQVIARNA
jgi:SAM-dependent methyltransferase